MANFKIAYLFTGKYEGSDQPDRGFQILKNDNGNWTGGKKGSGKLIGTIAGMTAPEIVDILGYIPTVDQVKNFPEDLIEARFKKKYWDLIRGDEIKQQVKANVIYDEAVNAGKGTSIIEAQELAGLPKTGVMDDKTLNYINAS